MNSEVKVRYFCTKCENLFKPEELEDFHFKEYEPDDYEYHCPEDNVTLQWMLL